LNPLSIKKHELEPSGELDEPAYHQGLEVWRHHDTNYPAWTEIDCEGVYSWIWDSFVVDGTISPNEFCNLHVAICEMGLCCVFPEPEFLQINEMCRKVSLSYTFPTIYEVFI
jgi:hypothetical protein